MSKKSCLVSFTARQRGGAIVIRVVSCSNLPDMDAAGRSDPYVKVTCNGNTQKTKVSDNFRNPVFDPSTSTFTFSIAGAPAGAHIFFDVMDKDTFSKDDLMGKVGARRPPATSPGQRDLEPRPAHRRRLRGHPLPAPLRPGHLR